MALMSENDPRFANLERRVGFFLLASVLIVIGAIALVGVRQGLFTPKTQLVFHDISGRDLAEGMEVFTRGFRIGKVKSVRLDDSGRVEVVLAIEKPLFRWIRQDSTARVVPKAFIGDTLIEISPGTQQAPPMPAGGVIVFVREPDLTDIAKKLMEDVKPVLLALKSLVEYLDNPQGDVKQAIANVNRLSAGLVETRDRLDENLAQLSSRVNALADNLDALAATLRNELLPRVTGLVDKGTGVIEDAGRTARSADSFVQEDLHGLTATLQNELVPQVRGLLVNTDRAAAAAGSSAEQISRDLPALLAQVNASLENIRLITEQLVPASKDAAETLRQGGELVEDAQALVRRTGGLWPFRTEKKKPETTIDVDSYQIKQTPGADPAPGPRAR